jgi:ribosomal protein L3 glutamine methyltransferase
MSDTVAHWIKSTARALERAKLHFGHGTDNALDEAAWLVGASLGLDPDTLNDHLNDRVAAAHADIIRGLTGARLDTRLPLAYLLREAWFAGLKFYVDERVLVPRSLTAEFILERFQPWVKPENVKRILDLCTGSGCMAIACAVSFPGANIDAADISPDALAVAHINIERHGLIGRVRPVESDVFSGLRNERYDLVVSNPPYVDAADVASMPPEYQYEPSLALAAGQHGLDVVARILREAASHLNDRGILVVEVGNSREHVERAWPTVPFMWLTTSSGDESVFVLTVEELRRHAGELACAG